MTTYHYPLGTVRWHKYNGEGDVRAYQAPSGWTALADLLDVHPITGEQMEHSEWWIRETYTGKK